MGENFHCHWHGPQALRAGMPPQQVGSLKQSPSFDLVSLLRDSCPPLPVLLWLEPL